MDITLNVANNYRDHVEGSAEWEVLANKLFKLQQMRKKIEQEEAELALQMKFMNNNQSTVGEYYVYSCSLRKGSIDYDKIPQLLHVNLEPYRKSAVIVWKLSTKE